MRPIMRLPLREALYVCSGCRQQAIPRITTPIATEFRRYASDGILERTRRQLWNTEKPPGAEDPYSGESQLLHKQEAEQRDLASEGEESTLAKGYEQAETWDGLSTIGFIPNEAWVYNGPSEADVYQRYDAGFVSRDVHSAANQAAIEICLLQLCGKPLDAMYDLKYSENMGKMIDSCTVEGSEVESIRFPNRIVKQKLLFLFENIGEWQKSRPTQKYEPVQNHGKKGDQKKSWNHLSLADPEIKFAFAKRVSALTARRIPDKAISSSATVGDFVAAMSTSLKDQPPNVVRKFARRKAAGALPPNIKFSGKRINKFTDDEDYGSKKVIQTELYNRGLVIPGK